MWWMILQAGLQAYSANENNDKKKVANSIARAEADATNRVRDTQNGTAQTIDKFNRWVQANNNALRMKAGASALDANTTNAVRRHDERTGQQFQSSVQRAEAAGQQAAAVGLSHVAGPVTDMIASSIALRDSIVTEGLRRQGLSENFDTARRAGAIMSQMINGQDNSILTPQVNRNKVTPDQLHESSGTGMFAPILASALATQAQTPTVPDQTASGTPNRVSDKFKFETSVAPGADDPFSFWVSK